MRKWCFFTNSSVDLEVPHFSKPYDASGIGGRSQIRQDSPSILVGSSGSSVIVCYKSPYFIIFHHIFLGPRCIFVSGNSPNHSPTRLIKVVSEPLIKISACEDKCLAVSTSTIGQEGAASPIEGVHHGFILACHGIFCSCYWAGAPSSNVWTGLNLRIQNR